MTCYEGAWSSGVTVRWRALTLGEFQQFRSRLLAGVPRAVVFLDLYRELVLDGPVPEALPAGILLWLGEWVMEKSPFSCQRQLVEQTLEEKRAEVRNSYLLSVQAILAGVFRCRFEEMGAWDADRFFQRVAQAELVLGRPLGVEDPEDPKKEQEKKMRRRLRRSE